MPEPVPASCPGNQPTQVNVAWNSQNWACGGGGSTCAWSDGDGYAEVYLNPGREWVLEISGAADGGPSQGTKDGSGVAGTYSNGGVVTVP